VRPRPFTDPPVACATDAASASFGFDEHVLLTHAGLGVARLVGGRNDERVAHCVGIDRVVRGLNAEGHNVIVSSDGVSRPGRRLRFEYRIGNGRHDDCVGCRLAD
jgi:hypothetical protein